VRLVSRRCQGLNLVSAGRGPSHGAIWAAITRQGRLAASQLPEPQRGADDHAEPAAADIPAAGADVESGELIAAQLAEIVVMHDASHDSQVRSCSGQLPGGDQDLGRGPTLTTTAWAGTALGDHRGGQTVAEMARLLRAAEVRAVLPWKSALALAAVTQLAPAYR
jgi:hypothetical protein